jgi:hypothetical protein
MALRQIEDEAVDEAEARAKVATKLRLGVHPRRPLRGHDRDG